MDAEVDVVGVEAVRCSRHRTGTCISFLSAMWKHMYLDLLVLLRSEVWREGLLLCL